jgi:4-hydroxy-tetrahydrodipicolinate synthase
MLREILRGTGVALVTPFKEDKSIDFEALQAVINFVIEGGVQYVVTLGTTGETPTLSREEKLDVIQATFSAVSARVPVVIGIGGNSTQRIVKDIETFPVKKATAILSASSLLQQTFAGRYFSAL